MPAGCALAEPAIGTRQGISKLQDGNTVAYSCQEFCLHTGAAAVIDSRRFFECFESAKATGGTDRLQNEPRGNLS
jgi:hypothetical protein